MLSRVAVVLPFASLSCALLTERFAVPTSILQVHLNKTLGSRFQLLFQSAAPITGTIHVLIAVLGLLLFLQELCQEVPFQEHAVIGSSGSNQKYFYREILNVLPCSSRLKLSEGRITGHSETEEQR